MAVLIGASLLGPTAKASAQSTPTVTPTPTPTPSATATATATATVTATPPMVELTSTPLPTFSSNVPCATDDPSAPGGIRRSDRRGSDDNLQGDNPDEFQTGNGRNEVVVHNCTNDRLRIRGNVQLNTIPGRVVAPYNSAYAESTCVNCQTLALALQINVYSSERATEIRPENYAVAVNSNCSHCTTLVRAIQFNKGVDDPRDLAQEIFDAVNDLDRELRAIQRDRNMSLTEADTRVNAVLDRFMALGMSLDEQRDQRDD